MRRLHRNEDEIRVMDSMNHCNTGCPLQVAHHDIVCVSKSLDDFPDRILIDLGGHDDWCLWHIGKGPIPDRYRKSRNVLPWRPYISCPRLGTVGKEFARMLLNKIGIDQSDTVAVERKMNGEIPDQVRLA